LEILSKERKRETLMNKKIRGVLETVKKFWKNADAQDLVEYALLLVLVALVAGATIRSLGTAVKNAFTQGQVALIVATLPGNATGTVNTALAGNVAVLNAAANVNAAAATAEAQAAAAAGGRNNVAAVDDNAAAVADGLAALDDGLAALAAQAGLGALANSLTAAANAQTAAAAADTAAAAGKVAVAGIGTPFGF
jgi:trimeric autotransporter adhesin